MKKLALGCLVVLLLGAVAVGIGLFYLYRAATPVMEDARAYLKGMGELSAIEEQVVDKSVHTPPASGELSETQVARFVNVQESVRTALGKRMTEIDAKYRALQEQQDPSFTDMISGLKDIFGVFVQARRYQVDALNKEGFSQDEYRWVRQQLFAAAGIEAASMIDVTQLEEAIRSGTGIDSLNTENLPRPDVPTRNRALVKPHLQKVDEWLPLAFFGL